MHKCHCTRHTWQEDQNSTLLLPTVDLSLVGTFPRHILQQRGQQVEVNLIGVSVGLHAGDMLLRLQQSGVYSVPGAEGMYSAS